MNENKITVSGRQDFMGHDIPVVLGGFGEDKKCICDKTIAEIHGQSDREIRRRIVDNIKRFAEKVDYIDLAQRVGESHTSEILKSMGYSQQSIVQAAHIYVLSERGYAKLIKIMDTDLAWEIHDKLIDEYFAMREHIAKAQLEHTGLSLELQMLKLLIDKATDTELEQKRQAAALTTVEQKVDGIREIVAIKPQSWRDECCRLLHAVAMRRGGGAAYKEVNAEAYQLVDERAGVSLATRLTNKRRRMADAGVRKSNRDKLNNLDVIQDDKKLVEIFIAVVKELAIKYGVALPSPADGGLGA